MNPDISLLQQWIGKRRRETDLASLFPLRALAATLDLDDGWITPGAAIPPLWHWLYFLAPAPQSALGADGHPRKGSFLPPVPLPRRMWAGGRLEFGRPLLAGSGIWRSSEIASVECKQGSTGTLVFVVVRHIIGDDHGECLQEEHDIVYREMPGRPDSPLAPGRPAPREAEFARSVAPDPVLLFRYSALTFNGHRIHYDRSYVTGVEGYPGLVVHGPLLATLLAQLWREQYPGRLLARFEFRSLRPVFDLHGFRVCGSTGPEREADLWISDHDGFLCMQARAVPASGDGRS